MTEPSMFVVPSPKALPELPIGGRVAAELLRALGRAYAAHGPEQLELFGDRPDEQLAATARELHQSADALAFALELRTPILGRVWLALCCSCLDRVDPGAITHRLAWERWQGWPGPCSRCGYSGCDTLVAAVDRESLRGPAVARA